VGSLSPLARPITPLKKGRTRRGRLHGVIAHTPGSTIVDRAQKKGHEPFEYVVEHYGRPESNWPTYVIGYDGRIAQITDEEQVTHHAGVDKAERRAFLSGAWRRDCERHKLWDAFWNPRGVLNPTDLYHLSEGAGVNDAFIGVEILPLVPTPKGLRYTEAQHEAFASLACDIVARHAIFDEDPARVVLGHEDVNPLTRFNGGGGWDPGGLRTQPWFDWPRVMRRLGGRR
jgi:hypothetical protein